MAGSRWDLLQALDETLFDVRRMVQHPTYRKRLLRGLSYEVELATVRLLRAVQRADDSPSVGEVAELLAIAPSTASRLIDRAVASGYVERLFSVEDRRRTRLQLSATGRSVLHEISLSRREILDEATDSWDDADLERLNRLLTVLVEDLGEITASE